MYYDCRWFETDLNERLKTLVSKLTFKAISWKMKILQGDQAGANQEIKEMENIIEQMRLYLTSKRIH